MNASAVPSRFRWQPWALPVLFGDERESEHPIRMHLPAALADLEASVASVRAEAREHGAQQPLAQPFVDSFALRPQGVYQRVDLRDPMRVVLAGRTTAGKSSLLAALTGAHADRVGDGRQRYSRDVLADRLMASDKIEIVDTPGVGAHLGEDDTEIALRAAFDADLIVWVNSDDSIQEDVGTALQILGALGKPIIVVLNCRRRLNVTGRMDLLQFPDKVFGNKEGLLEEIERHLAAAGVEPLTVVSVHALAAIESGAAAELRAASRIGDLTEVLLEEHAIHSRGRRLLRMVDNQRRPAETLALSLADAATSMQASAERERTKLADMRNRTGRVLLTAEEGMRAEVEAAISSRRDWHLSVEDFGPQLEAAWAAEVSEIRAQVDRLLQRRLSALAADTASAITSAEAEWSSVSNEQFRLDRLMGFGSVWKNRIGRVGIGLAGAGLLALLGLLVPPAAPAAVPLAVALGGGAVVSPFIGIGQRRLKLVLGRVFLGKDEVLRRRRQELEPRLGAALDSLTDAYTTAIADRVAELRDSLDEGHLRASDQAAAVSELGQEWVRLEGALRSRIADLDRQTAAALLSVAGRERLAGSVARATRVPGVCILAEFTEEAFWEAWLFPPHLGEKLAAGKPASAGGESGRALTYTLGLLDAPARLSRADEKSALVTVTADVSSDIFSTWSAALTAHLDRQISIASIRKAGS